MAFRLANHNPVFLDDDGLPCAGGSLTFTRSGTTTAHPVYTDSGLGTSLGNVLTLGSDGRPEDGDFWMSSVDFAYRVVLAKSDATVVWTRDDIAELGSTGEPAPVPSDGDEGQVWTTNGVTADWETPSYVPDMAGHAGKILGTDGANALWQAIATYTRDTLPGGLVDGGGSPGYFDFGNIRVQWGSDTAPTASGITTSKAVTFSQVFESAPWFICIGVNAQAVTTENTHASSSFASPTTTGFTAHFFCGGENAGAGSTDINSTIPFRWLAIGERPE